ncbi:uncharacterized protein [Ptychodera flava]|uniref:uncharacterized protein n=1 Tax=Ptychodera flava TaxID=63121 RepID=UPI00396A666A
MASGNPSTKVVTALQTPIITTSTVTRMSTTRVATPVVTIAVSTVPTSSTPIMSAITSGSTANVQHNANVAYIPSIPEWERSIQLDPTVAYHEHLLRRVKYTSWNGFEAPTSVVPYPELEVKNGLNVSVKDLRFRDPNFFLAGGIHTQKEAWFKILRSQDNERQVGHWIEHGVSVFDFIAPFKGEIFGTRYNCSFPPSIYLPNNPICRRHRDFVSSTLLDRVKSGALEIWGAVGKVPPPYIVMPLTIEPTKPRLCHDQRYINNWIKDMPFKLELITNLPSYLGSNHYQTKIDDKSGYDHVCLWISSRALMGIHCGGFWYVPTTLPFGWKCSPFIYKLLV